MPRLPESLRIPYDASRFVRHLGLGRLSRELIARSEARIARWTASAPRGEVRPVERRIAITPTEFQRFIASQTPVVLEGFAKDWPAIQRWSPQYLADRHGDDVVVLADKDAGDGVYNKVGGKAMMLSLREVVARLHAGRRVNQTFDSILHRHPELGADFRFDALTALLPQGTRTGIRDSFMGAKGTATPIHAAISNNLFTCVHGIKRWTFYHPRCDWAFRPNDGGTPYFVSNCMPDAPDPASYPSFPWADALTVDLHPGDVVYVPPFWWHYVQNLDHAIGVAFRWINLLKALRRTPMKTLMVLTATKPSVLAVERAKRKNDFSMPFRLREEVLD